MHISQALLKIKNPSSGRVPNWFLAHKIPTLPHQLAFECDVLSKSLSRHDLMGEHRKMYFFDEKILVPNILLLWCRVEPESMENKWKIVFTIFMLLSTFWLRRKRTRKSNLFALECKSVLAAAYIADISTIAQSFNLYSWLCECESLFLGGGNPIYSCIRVTYMYVNK